MWKIIVRELCVFVYVYQKKQFTIVGLGHFCHASLRELLKHACLGHNIWLYQSDLPKIGIYY